MSAVVIDFVLAEISGGALAARLRELRADLSIVYVTGLTVDEPALQSALAHPRTKLLTTPIEISTLVTLLRDMCSIPITQAVASRGGAV